MQWQTSDETEGWIIKIAKPQFIWEIFHRTKITETWLISIFDVLLWNVIRYSSQSRRLWLYYAHMHYSFPLNRSDMLKLTQIWNMSYWLILELWTSKLKHRSHMLDIFIFQMFTTEYSNSADYNAFSIHDSVNKKADFAYCECLKFMKKKRVNAIMRRTFPQLITLLIEDYL